MFDAKCAAIAIRLYIFIYFLKLFEYCCFVSWKTDFFVFCFLFFVFSLSVLFNTAFVDTGARVAFRRK